MNQRFGFRLVWGENSIGIAIDEIFLTTPFEGGRHARRLAKIPAGFSRGDDDD